MIVKFLCDVEVIVHQEKDIVDWEVAVPHLFFINDEEEIDEIVELNDQVSTLYFVDGSMADVPTNSFVVVERT